MLWLTAGTTLALVAISTNLGTLGTGLMILATAGWLLLAFRPLAAGELVASWARRRFE
jgi:hypothetical protein